MDTSAPAPPTPNKPTAEGFRFLVRYSEAINHKPDAKAVAKAAGISYHVAWRSIDTAKKELAAEGYVFADQVAVAREPKAKGGRKRKGKAVEAEEEDTEVKAEPEKKRSKRGESAKKSVEVKEEPKEESDTDTEIKFE